MGPASIVLFSLMFILGCLSPRATKWWVARDVLLALLCAGGILLTLRHELADDERETEYTEAMVAAETSVQVLVTCNAMLSLCQETCGGVR